MNVSNVYSVAETVMLHLRLNKELVKEIDNVVKEEHYNSRTEFLGEAARKRLEDKRIKKLVEQVEKRKGLGKRLGYKLPSDEELERIRQNVWFELHGKK